MPAAALEKLVAYSYAVLTIVFYAVFAWYRTRSYGPTLRARFDRLLALREPAIVLDSARVLVLLAWMRNTPDLELVPEYLRRGVEWSDPVGVFRWISVFTVPPAAMSIGVWAYRLALALAIAGVMGRAASAAAAVLHALLWSVSYSTIGYSVHNHVVFMILLALALAPEPFVPIWRYAAALRDRRPLASAGTYASYVSFSASFAIVTLYVQTGIEKVLHGGPQWFSGITLQGHAMRKEQWSLHLTALPLIVLIVLSVLTVLWETGFGLVYFYPRLRPFAVMSAWGFHEFIRHGMGVTPFAFMMSGVLFVYTPYEAYVWIARRSSKKRPAGAAIAAEPERPARPPPTLATASVLALIALCTAQWMPTVLRRGVYPFLSNAMFSSSLRPGTLIPAEGHMIVRTSDGEEKVANATQALAVHRITFTELLFEHYASTLRDHARNAETRQKYCEDLLAAVVQHAEPKAVELLLTLDYFRAAELGMRTDTLYSCRLGDLSAGPGKSSKSATD